MDPDLDILPIPDPGVKKTPCKDSALPGTDECCFAIRTGLIQERRVGNAIVSKEVLHLRGALQLLLLWPAAVVAGQGRDFPLIFLNSGKNKYYQSFFIL
jgi:hypothetical protein